MLTRAYRQLLVMGMAAGGLVGCAHSPAPDALSVATTSVTASTAPDRSSTPETSPVSRATQAVAQPCAAWGTPSAAVTELLGRMDLDRKIGQILMTHVYGADANTVDAASAAANKALYGVATPSEVVRRWHLGGIAYLGRNTQDPDRPDLPTHNTDKPLQTAVLSNGLQSAAGKDGSVGLLIGVDQEGGRVTRVGPPATQFPAQAVFGRTGSADLVRAAAHATAQELRAIGINEDFAPVADVNVEPGNEVIGDRSYGPDPTEDAALTAAAVGGYQSAGVAATAKHFPGHGDTRTDSHTGLPVIDHDEQTWRQLDRPPFASAIDAGVCTVMVGHLAFPALDPSGLPATLSPRLMGLLRIDLHFDGVVVTDSLWMAGVRQNRDDASVAVDTFLAGADILLSPPDLDEAFVGVKQAVLDGRLGEGRVDRSVARILSLKEALGILEPPHVDVASAAGVLGADEHQQIDDDVRGAN